MTVFHTDLDNTLIYSYKHDIGGDKRSVELYQGREISYISGRTFSLLREVKKKILIVPVTTRTIEQYSRIDLGTGPFEYALVCNGGVLLVNGKKDPEWYRESRKLIEESEDELHRAMRFLEKDARRSFELRFIEDLFVFTKCDFPREVTDDLRKELDGTAAEVFHNGSKVYVLPKKLSKGMAVMRFREYLQPSYVIAAGDSRFDLSMLEAADKGLAPHGFARKYRAEDKVLEMDERKLFSEAVLEECLKTTREKP